MTTATTPTRPFTVHVTQPTTNLGTCFSFCDHCKRTHPVLDNFPVAQTQQYNAFARDDELSISAVMIDATPIEPSQSPSQSDDCTDRARPHDTTRCVHRGCPYNAWYISRSRLRCRQGDDDDDTSTPSVAKPRDVTAPITLRHTTIRETSP